MGELLEKNRVEYETLFYAVTRVREETAGNVGPTVPMQLWSISPSGAMKEPLRSFILDKGINVSPFVKTIWEAAVSFAEKTGQNTIFALHRSGDSSEPIATFTVFSTTDLSIPSEPEPDEAGSSCGSFEGVMMYAIQTIAEMNQSHLTLVERALNLQATTIERQIAILEKQSKLIDELTALLSKKLT